MIIKTRGCSGTVQAVAEYFNDFVGFKLKIMEKVS